jgi:SAM-dependent methyltransferase
VTTIAAGAVWHDLECGRYTADLACWRGLAADRGGPILDVGAGAGRVAIDLAARGHEVTALDRDADLLGELSRRAGSAGARLTTVIADARDFHLDERFALIIVPMQTIQLLRPRGRTRFLACAVENLRAGGRLAVAITEHFDLYDERAEDAHRLPTPEVHDNAGTIYISQATAVRQVGDMFILQRRREVIPADGARLVEMHQDRIDSLTADQLELEASAVGLRATGRTEVGATSDHVGSVVVMLDA